jgi:hypothetical protein
LITTVLAQLPDVRFERRHDGGQITELPSTLRGQCIEQVARRDAERRLGGPVRRG